MTETTAPIPIERLDWADRRLCRQVAATLTAVMAETDTGFPQMAKRLGVDESVCRNWMKRLIDGTATDLRGMSDMTCAMGCMWEISLSKLPEFPMKEVNDAKP